MRRRAATLLLAVLPLAAAFPLLCGRSSLAEEPDIEFHRDLVFGKGGDDELKLDLAHPAGKATPRPAVLVLHGGGWRAGSKEMHDDLVRFLAREGYVAVTASYRLAPKAPWPAQIEDAKCAVRWMRAEGGRFGIDPDRIAALGFSAGAHLAMLLGTMGPDDGLEGTGGHAGQPSKVQAVVSFFGPTDLDLATPDVRAEELSPQRLKEEVAGRLLGGLLGPVFRADPKAASPLTYVSRGDAPMLLIQGTRDPLVPYAQATQMLDALTEARVPGEVVFLLGLGHGWGDPHLTDSVETTLRFLDRQLRPARRASLLPRIRGS
jgi:acetyl esterase/lipase